MPYIGFQFFLRKEINKALTKREVLLIDYKFYQSCIDKNSLVSYGNLFHNLPVVGLSLIYFPELPTSFRIFWWHNFFTKYNQLISHHAKFKSPTSRTGKFDSKSFCREFFLDDESGSGMLKHPNPWQISGRSFVTC